MRLYKTPTASEYLWKTYGIDRAPSYLQKLRVISGGPEFRKIGCRNVAYEERALDAYAQALVSRPLRSTSEAVPAPGGC